MAVAVLTSLTTKNAPDAIRFDSVRALCSSQWFAFHNSSTHCGCVCTSGGAFTQAGHGAAGAYSFLAPFARSSAAKLDKLRSDISPILLQLTGSRDSMRTVKPYSWNCTVSFRFHLYFFECGSFSNSSIVINFSYSTDRSSNIFPFRCIHGCIHS